MRVINSTASRVFSIFLLLTCSMFSIGSYSQVTGNSKELVSVMNPTGYPPPIERKSMAVRPDSLNGKTIYLVDNTFNNGDVYLLEMQKWFKSNLPAVNTIFRAKKGAYFTDDPDLWNEIKSVNGLMIMAIGH